MLDAISKTVGQEVLLHSPTLILLKITRCLVPIQASRPLYTAAAVDTPQNRYLCESHCLWLVPIIRGLDSVSSCVFIGLPATWQSLCSTAFRTPLAPAPHVLDSNALF